MAAWGCLALVLFVCACGSTATANGIHEAPMGSSSANTPAGNVSGGGSVATGTPTNTSTGTPGTVNTTNANVTPLNIPAIASPLQCPQSNGIIQPGTFVQSNGQHFTYANKVLQLNGFTFYPSIAGGTSAWRSSQFTQYVDHVIGLGLQAGQNVIRPTDFWDNSDPKQQVDDPTIWQNLDYVVCAAQQHGMFVVMDLSAFKWLLVSHGQDFSNTDFWRPFLVTVAAHYRNVPAIAFYSIVGEPQPPTTPAASQQLVEFYKTLTDTLYAADSNHLISAGGFNHMENETPQTPWWHQIYALPHNDVASFKTYSQSDLNLMATIAQYGKSIHRPIFDEEFGMPQSLGDGSFAGGSGYNSITTSRAQFYANVYSTGQSLGVAGYVFWNLGCQVGSTSYEVSPLTPAVWQVVTQYAPASPVAAGASCP